MQRLRARRLLSRQLSLAERVTARPSFAPWRIADERGRTEWAAGTGYRAALSGGRRARSRRRIRRSHRSPLERRGAAARRPPAQRAAARNRRDGADFPLADDLLRPAGDEPGRT